jgi:hypothetical protein
MAGYLLNLTVKRPASALVATGLFNDYSVDPTSKVWYQIPSTWPGVLYTPPSPVTQPAAVTTWPQTAPFPVRDDGSFGCKLDDDIYMRVVPDGSWPPSVNNNNLVIGFDALFGRPATSGHGGATMATPFVLGTDFGPGNNSPRSSFAWSVLAPTSSDGSSIYYLGQPAQNVVGQKGRGGSSSGDCSYSFIVGAYLAYPNVEGWTFGHDPKIIVSGGGVKP